MRAGAKDGKDDCGQGEQKKTAYLATALKLFSDDFLRAGMRGLRWQGHGRAYCWIGML
jgi:hypothetical protein